MPKTDLITAKYEIVIGVPDVKFINGRFEDQAYAMVNKWQEYAKEYYDKTGIYVSAIANEGKAIYNKDWGCPDGGERTLTFNCTPNRVFIEDIIKYRQGIAYIVAKLKKEFEQHTITITNITPATMDYFTDEDNEFLNGVITHIESTKEAKNNE